MGYETVLTDARTALWSAIEEFDDLKGAFQAKYKFDSDNSVLKEAEPAFSDLNAIGIWPLGFVPKWYVNTKQRWPYSLRIVVWTANWVMPTAEKLAVQIARAIHRSAPANTPTVPYLHSLDPKVGPSTTFEMTRIHKEDNPVKVVKSRLDVVLQCNFQPNT